VKYYTTKDERNFSDWMKRRIDNILDEVADKKDKVDNEKIKEKIELVEEKLRGIAKEEMVSTTSLKDVLLSLEMKDNLKLF
jgi:transcriptional regulator NrdR family protein